MSSRIWGGGENDVNNREEEIEIKQYITAIIISRPAKEKKVGSVKGSFLPSNFTEKLFSHTLAISGLVFVNLLRILWSRERESTPSKCNASKQ